MKKKYVLFTMLILVILLVFLLGFLYGHKVEAKIIESKQENFYGQKVENNSEPLETECSKLEVDIVPIEEATDKEKYLYRKDKNENEICFKLTPRFIEKLDKSEDVKIEVFLLPDLEYIPQSCNYMEPTIEKDETGAILSWQIQNCISDKDIESITYKVKINKLNVGHIETTVNVGVLCDNYEENSYVKDCIVYYSDTESISQLVNTPLIEKDGIINYKLVINQLDLLQDIEINNLRLGRKTYYNYIVDVLPFNGDTRGTCFNGTYTIKQINVSLIDKNTNEKIEDNEDFVKVIRFQL